MGRSARAHVIFRMDLEPAEIGPTFEDIAVMLRLETTPARAGIGSCRKRPRFGAADVTGSEPQPLTGFSELLRIMPSLSLTLIDSQEPFATYFQAPLS